MDICSERASQRARDNTQNFNRYSYVLNNPLKYTNQSGEFIFSALLPGVGVFIDAALWGAVIGGASYTASVAFSDGGFSNWNWGQFGQAVGMGAISGVATAGIGSAFGQVGSMGVWGEVGRAMAHAYANAFINLAFGNDISAGSYLAAFGGSLVGSGTHNFSVGGQIGVSAFTTGAIAEMSGGDFWRGAATGATIAALNHTAHVVKSSIEAGIHVKAVRAFLKDLGFDPSQVDADVVKQTNRFFGKYYAKLNKAEKYTSGWSEQVDSRSGNVGYVSEAKYVLELNSHIRSGVSYSRNQGYRLKYYPDRANSIGLIRANGGHYTEAVLEIFDGAVRSVTGYDNVIYNMHYTNSYNYLRYR